MASPTPPESPELTSSAILAPPGFPAVDEFGSAAEACEQLTPRLVTAELRTAVLNWCHARAYHSSRDGRVRSRMDGSWIHDRDRPSAYDFYRQGVRAGVLDPETCPHHLVDTETERSRDERAFPERWPYSTYCDYSQGACNPSRPGKMLAAVAANWMRHPPGYEQFGTRGPFDNNHWVATKYLGGCFPPDQLDRFDVGAAVVIKRSVELCAELDRRLSSSKKRKAAKDAGLPTSYRSHRDLRAIWNPRFWYSRLPEVLSSAG